MLVGLGRSALLLALRRGVMTRAVKKARTLACGGDDKKAPSAAAAGGAAPVPPLPARAAAAPARAPPPPVSIPLGVLVPALVLRRPSATVRTPYVADVARLAPNATAEAAAAAAAASTPSSILQAHTPAMDCAGLIAPGRRVHAAPLAASSSAKRTTHSVVLAEDTRADGRGDALVCAHPASAERLAAAALRAGAIAELAGGMRSVLAQQTVSSVVAVVEEGAAAAAAAAGGGKAAAGTKAAAAAGPPSPSSSASESSRVDFVVEREDGSVALVEVKIVVCADYPSAATGRAPALVPGLAGASPSGKGSKGVGLVGVYCPAPAPFPEAAAAGGAAPDAKAANAAANADAPYTRTAIFPHGAVKKGAGVVSDRAIKHVTHLERLLREGRALVGGRERRVAGAAVLFVVARADCAAFRPCHEACPVFARVLSRAQRRGVQVLAYDVSLDLGGGGGGGGGGEFGGAAATMALRGSLPVILDAFGADEDDVALDATVARVLEFNATDPRTHYKKKQVGAGAKKAPAAAGAAAGKGKGKKKKKKESESDEDTEEDTEEDESDDDDDGPPKKKKAAAAAPKKQQPARGKRR